MSEAGDGGEGAAPKSPQGISPSDAERQVVADRCRDAVTAGLLPFSELEARIDMAYSVKTLGELELLVRWLPALKPVPSRRQTGRGPVLIAGFALAGVGAALAVVVAFAVGAHGNHGAASRVAAGAATSIAPTSAARPSPTPTTVAANTTGTAPSGFAEGNESAIIAVNPAQNTLTLDTNNQDVTYRTCSSFTAVAGGKQLRLSGISAGEFAVVDVDISAPCAKSLKVIPPPEPRSCIAVGFDGEATVTWEGFSIPGRSVLYRPTGPDEAILAVRWCGAPTVTTHNGQAASPSAIKVGTPVEITFAGGPQGPWLRSVVAEGG